MCIDRPAWQQTFDRGEDRVDGRDDVPDGVEHVAMWLADQPAPGNPNLDFVLREAVDAVATLRAAGRRVYLHCVGGRSRTPTVAYLAATTGVSGAEALGAIARCLPRPPPTPRSTPGTGSSSCGGQRHSRSSGESWPHTSASATDRTLMLRDRA